MIAFRWTWLAVFTLTAFVWAPSAHAEAPAPAPAASVSMSAVEAEQPVAGYDKGFFIRAPHAPFSLTINGRVQARYSFEAVDGGTNESSFSIPRARLALKGYAFTPNLSYKFQADFGKGFVSLKDFFVDYTFCPVWLRVRAGQWKRPFSRQQITSSGHLELVDRAATDSFFGAGRDIGVAIHNNYEKSPTFEYALGIFNGTGEKPTFSGDATVDLTTGEGEVTSGKFSNVPGRFHPSLVLRVGYNYGGIKGYSEADLEGGPLRFAVGASGQIDFDADNSNDGTIRGEGDYIVKLHGFSSTGGVYVASTQSGTTFGDQAFSAVGFHAQAGYLLAKYVEPVVRYSLIVPDGPDNDEHELLGGISVYFFEHKLKLQADAGALIAQAPGNDTTDFRLRTQLQLAL